MQLVKSQLFGVQPSDPWTMVSVLTLMMLVAGAAAYVPARRAARVDPLVALRQQ
jgi:ABC-type lipoprotein release transport system permease subunit